MYLEQPRAFGATQVYPKTRVQCNDGTFDVSNGIVEACRTHGGVAVVTPSIPPKPKFMPSYGLTANYSYGSCKSGYVKQMVNMPDPNAYSCFDPAELAWNKKYGIMF
jgi:hypothetical protein